MIKSEWLCLQPEKEFAVRTCQQSAQSLSQDQAIDLVCELVRAMAIKDQIIMGLVKETLA